MRSAYGLPHTLATPLVADRRFLGALLLARRGREAWSEGDRRLLTWAANEVATAFQRAYALEDAERGAKIDVLTGLPNRRYFDEVLAIERPRRRANDSIGILMVDIDHFKILNDRFGHATGDRVLRAVATAIGQAVRAEDTPARYGGEEFAVLLRRAVGRAGHRGRRAHPARGGAPAPGQPGHRRTGHGLGRRGRGRARGDRHPRARGACRPGALPCQAPGPRPRRRCLSARVAPGDAAAAR